MTFEINNNPTNLNQTVNYIIDYICNVDLETNCITPNISPISIQKTINYITEYISDINIQNYISMPLNINVHKTIDYIFKYLCNITIDNCLFIPAGSSVVTTINIIIQYLTKIQLEYNCVFNEEKILNLHLLLNKLIFYLCNIEFDKNCLNIPTPNNVHTILQGLVNYVCQIEPKYNCIDIYDRIYRLTTEVVTDGVGGGRIISFPLGIDCGSDCQQEFVGGSSVILEAIPSNLSKFVKWEGPIVEDNNEFLLPNTDHLYNILDKLLVYLCNVYFQPTCLDIQEPLSLHKTINKFLEYLCVINIDENCMDIPTPSNLHTILNGIVKYLCTIKLSVHCFEGNTFINYLECDVNNSSFGMQSLLHKLLDYLCRIKLDYNCIKVSNPGSLHEILNGIFTYLCNIRLESCIGLATTIFEFLRLFNQYICEIDIDDCFHIQVPPLITMPTVIGGTMTPTLITNMPPVTYSPPTFTAPCTVTLTVNSNMGNSYTFSISPSPLTPSGTSFSYGTTVSLSKSTTYVIVPQNITGNNAPPPKSITTSDTCTPINLTAKYGGILPYMWAPHTAVNGSFVSLYNTNLRSNVKVLDVSLRNMTGASRLCVENTQDLTISVKRRYGCYMTSTTGPNVQLAKVLLPMPYGLQSNPDTALSWKAYFNKRNGDYIETRYNLGTSNPDVSDMLAIDSSIKGFNHGGSELTSTCTDTCSHGVYPCGAGDLNPNHSQCWGNTPKSCTSDDEGNIYVGWWGFNKIQKFNPYGQLLGSYNTSVGKFYGFIYYSGFIYAISTENGVYRFPKNNPSSLTKLKDGSFYSFHIFEDKIYLTHIGENRISRMNLDGSNWTISSDLLNHTNETYRGIVATPHGIYVAGSARFKGIIKVDHSLNLAGYRIYDENQTVNPGWANINGITKALDGSIWGIGTGNNGGCVMILDSDETYSLKVTAQSYSYGDFAGNSTASSVGTWE